MLILNVCVCLFVIVYTPATFLFLRGLYSRLTSNTEDARGGSGTVPEDHVYVREGIHMCKVRKKWQRGTLTRGQWPCRTCRRAGQ